MEEIKLNDDVIEQIRDFNHKDLTEEQKLLIDKLILNEELKECYKKYGLCKCCEQPNTGYESWCESLHGKWFQQNFQNWTSGNHDIDELIQRTQLKPKNQKLSFFLTSLKIFWTEKTERAFCPHTSTTF